MKRHVLHTAWCNISGEAAEELWNWSLLGVKGLIMWALYAGTHFTELEGWKAERTLAGKVTLMFMQPSTRLGIEPSGTFGLGDQDLTGAPLLPQEDFIPLVMQVKHVKHGRKLWRLHEFEKLIPQSSYFWQIQILWPLFWRAEANIWQNQVPSMLGILFCAIQLLSILWQHEGYRIETENRE